MLREKHAVISFFKVRVVFMTDKVEILRVFIMTGMIPDCCIYLRYSGLCKPVSYVKVGSVKIIPKSISPAN
jgi:hypothetical protein